MRSGGVKESTAFALLVLFTLGWAAYSAFEFYLSTLNSDCGYSPAEVCTRYAQYEQQLIVWRGLALQLAAVLAFVGLRKH